MTHEELVAELRATREAASALELRVVQFNLMAKRAFLRDPDLGEVGALYARDIRESLEALKKRADLFAAALAHAMGDAGPKGGGGR